MAIRAIPFVVGQWVRGERFYGRREQIEEILGGPRESIWLLGTRRIGKTSLLKQLEHLTATRPERGYFPIFWDFQGADDPAELHLNFADALLDAEERLQRIGIRVEDVEASDLFASLGRLRRRLRAEELRLLLLCDEVEELIKLRREHPALLRKLRRVMQSQEDMRSVLASTIRLWALAAQQEDTSPFLHGFTPPLYIERLSDAAARSLIEQSQLAPERRPGFADEEVESIRERCDNHPFLIQLVAKRFLELGELEAAIDEVATDRMVSYFFSVDFEMLSDTERRLVRLIDRHSGAVEDSLEAALPPDADSLRGALVRLQNLGFIRPGEQGGFALSNYFFRRWLRQMPSRDSAFLPERPSSAPGAQLGTLRRGGDPDVVDDRYRILERAGQGGTGIVYRAWDALLDTEIAIKILRREYGGSIEALERFRQEIVLARDIAHPNILRVYHLGDFEDGIYLTMQWVEGPTLARVIRERAPLGEGEVRSIGAKLASALEAAHARRILHRDMKPQNVILDPSGEPLVADFGLARLQGDARITRSGMFLGTPGYASPEQARFEPADERADIYSLGVILFEMATGAPPFEAESIGELLRMHRSTPPPDPVASRPGLSPALARLILRCLEKDPAARYPSAGALREALES